MSNTELIVAVVAGLAGFLIAVAALLRGWNGWLDLKRDQLEQAAEPRPASPSPAARIELADLKERVRRLESIANGVEG